MCAICGCGVEHEHEHHGHDHEHHHHDHDHDHHHDHEHRDPRLVQLEVDVLAHNDHLAAHNRAWLVRRGVVALNLLSSPGAGKTTLLERALHDLGGSPPALVIEGDQETELDADRIRATGTRALQIQTGTGCHLDARMIGTALRELDPPRGALVLIENVGNLVCPALFDLGERAKIVVASVTDGAEKPLKYPHMFRAADLVVVNKIDLAPYVSFDLDVFESNLRRVQPRAACMSVSATRGDGMRDFVEWLRSTTTRNEEARA